MEVFLHFKAHPPANSMASLQRPSLHPVVYSSTVVKWEEVCLTHFSRVNWDTSQPINRATLFPISINCSKPVPMNSCLQINHSKRMYRTLIFIWGNSSEKRLKRRKNDTHSRIYLRSGWNNNSNYSHQWMNWWLHRTRKKLMSKCCWNRRDSKTSWSWKMKNRHRL